MNRDGLVGHLNQSVTASAELDREFAQRPAMKAQPRRLMVVRTYDAVELGLRALLEVLNALFVSYRSNSEHANILARDCF